MNTMNIYIFGFEKSYAGSMVGLFDIFSRARQLSIAQAGASQCEEIDIKLASVDGKPLLCQNGIRLDVHCYRPLPHQESALCRH